MPALLFPPMGARIFKTQRIGAGFRYFQAVFSPGPRPSPVLGSGHIWGRYVGEKSPFSEAANVAHSLQ